MNTLNDTPGPTLTALQLETLLLVADGKVTYVRSGAGAWRVRGANPSVVGRLEQTLKLIDRGEIIIGAKDYYRYHVTDAGRTAIDKAQAA